MRSVNVSTDVFARIWALRAPGEDSEDSILKRVLWQAPPITTAGSGFPKDPTGPRAESLGFTDSRFGVSVPEGFEIFRSYLGRNYRARAFRGRWSLNTDGQSYDSLNELSRAIGAKTENAWKNWHFEDTSGVRRLVSELRNPTMIISRTREETVESAQTEQLEGAPSLRTALADGTWRDDVRTALENLGGRASLIRIYKEVERLRKSAGRSVPPSLEATIRRTLEDHSSDSENYRGIDLFCMPEGKGVGIWALR